jgi:hypothetical protein
MLPRGSRGWLAANRKQWKTLDVEGAPSAVEALPRATLEDDPVPVLDLPESFDAYFEGLPGQTRRRHRRRLRNFDRARGEVAQASEVGPAVHELIQLHNRRAKAKGEMHPQMNEQLARMLELVSKDSLDLVVTRMERRRSPCAGGAPRLWPRNVFLQHSDAPVRSLI